MRIQRVQTGLLLVPHALVMDQPIVQTDQETILLIEVIPPLQERLLVTDQVITPQTVRVMEVSQTELVNILPIGLVTILRTEAIPLLRGHLLEIDLVTILQIDRLPLQRILEITPHQESLRTTTTDIQVTGVIPATLLTDLVVEVGLVEITLADVVVPALEAEVVEVDAVVEDNLIH